MQCKCALSMLISSKPFRVYRYIEAGELQLNSWKQKGQFLHVCCKRLTHCRLIHFMLWPQGTKNLSQNLGHTYWSHRWWRSHLLMRHHWRLERYKHHPLAFWAGPAAAHCCNWTEDNYRFSIHSIMFFSLQSTAKCFVFPIAAFFLQEKNSI